MLDEFFELVGEFGVHIGATLVQKAAEPECDIDPIVITNVVFDSAVEQASLIVQHLGLGQQLDTGQFGTLVGIIATTQLGMAGYLAKMKLSFDRDLTRDIEQSCRKAVNALRREGAR